MSDFSGETNNLNMEVNGSETIYPIRVVMIADSGEIFTLLLPDTMEGRYRFTDSFGIEKSQFTLKLKMANGLQIWKNRRFLLSLIKTAKRI